MPSSSSERSAERRDATGFCMDIILRLGKMEQILARIDEKTKCLDDHEIRIRRLEETKARMGGVIAALTTVASAVGAGLVYLVQHVVAKGVHP